MWWSTQIPTGFLVLRSTWETPTLILVFVYRTITFFGRAFQPVHLTAINTPAYSGSAWCSHDPITKTACPYNVMVWADPVSLAATQGIVFTLSSSRYLDVSVPWVPTLCLCVQHRAIQKSPDQSLPTAPRSLSQLSHVFLRLLAPRHPPNTLNNLIAR